ncbi:MAG: hypothetical protein HUJ65_00245, partial [Oscillospiraceae bacterium]|nr:hypothetical protein [Oscillospiraceae bacterium]
NEKNGFTYSDDKNGIYMFYDTDSGIFAGSAIAAGYYAIIAGVCTVALAAICILISKKSKKRTAAQ